MDAGGSAVEVAGRLVVPGVCDMAVVRGCAGAAPQAARSRLMITIISKPACLFAISLSPSAQSGTYPKIREEFGSMHLRLCCTIIKAMLPFNFEQKQKHYSLLAQPGQVTAIPIII
jgi:hypothetical protein